MGGFGSGRKPKRLCGINGCKYARSTCVVHFNHYAAWKMAEWRKRKLAGIAQLGERDYGKVEATGSIPVPGPSLPM